MQTATFALRGGDVVFGCPSSNREAIAHYADLSRCTALPEAEPTSAPAAPPPTGPAAAVCVPGAAASGCADDQYCDAAQGAQSGSCRKRLAIGEVCSVALTPCVSGARCDATSGATSLYFAGIGAIGHCTANPKPEENAYFYSDHVTHTK